MIPKYNTRAEAQRVEAVIHATTGSSHVVRKVRDKYILVPR